MESEFLHEDLLWGYLGNILISLSTAGAFLAFVAYYFAIKKPLETGWKKIGKTAFIIHAGSMAGIVSIMFYLLLSHQFEYHYVWQHTNKSMPAKYVFASFWEGQEGSFMLWMFWNAVIGSILLFRAKSWEPGVMMIFGIVQVWLMSMIWGIVIPYENIKIGSNPFILTRLHPDMLNMPFTKSATYLETLDGRGLNPALQNYWMTIHPPTLFLGFALTLVPFAYALAGLKMRDFKGWVRPALPWAFTCVAILGLGILMGGAWAYEALNFGGFWNWDPVENTSLMPWLIMVAGAHLMLVTLNRGTNLFITTLLTVFSFIFTLFSTFCTRSGVLGDASVHAFTDLGMMRQLELFLFFFMWLPAYFVMRKANEKTSFLILSIFLLAGGFLLDFSLGVTIAYLVFFLGAVVAVWYIYRRNEPSVKKSSDESIYSREFWMFIGSLVLVITTLHLVIETSKPIFNLLFEEDYGVGKVDDYNRIQSIFAVIITLLMAVTQFLRYRNTDRKAFLRGTFRSFAVTVLLIIAGVVIFPRFRNPVYIILTFTALFAILGNIDYIIQFVKTRWKLAGASVAHAGFGLVMFGAIISAGHKNIISANVKELNLEVLNPDFKNNENVMLHKGDTVQMGNYYLSYSQDSVAGINIYFRVDYLKKSESGEFTRAFTLYPRVQINERMGNVAEPSTLHLLHKDIFTHVVYVDKEKLEATVANTFGEFKEAQHETVAIDETIVTEFAFITLKSVDLVGDRKEIDTANFQTKLQAKFFIKTFKGDTATASPVISIDNNIVEPESDFEEKTGLKFTVTRIMPGEDNGPTKVEVEIAEKKQNEKNDYIIMQAIIFPGINLLWSGSIIMVLGTILAVFARWRKTQRT